jgi:hypothetical protein
MAGSDPRHEHTRSASRPRIASASGSASPPAAALGTRTMTGVDLQLRGQRRFRGSVTGNVCAYVGGQMIFADGVSLSSSKSRKNFLRELRRHVDDGALNDAEIERALLDLMQLAESALENEVAPDAPAELEDEVRIENYVQHDGRYYYVRMRGSGDDAVEERIPLSTFAAEITEEVVVDDGVDTHRYFCLAGQFSDGRPLPPTRIPATDFSSMGWVTDSWGVHARILPGPSTRDRVRDAIQAFSVGAPEHRIYGHSGWRRIGNQWAFLHADGAITADGVLADVTVELAGHLGRYALPDPSMGDTLVHAVRTAWELWSVADPVASASILGSVYGAPLSEWIAPAFVLWVQGLTGRLKTTYVTLALAHCGTFSWDQVPANWESSANSLEKQAFLIKDLPFLIDDYRPPVDRRDAAEMQHKAARIIRAAGNRTGRGRMRADTSLRPEYYPRGVVIVTGEDRPPGESAGARRWLVEFDEHTVNLERLSAAQAQTPALRRAMAAFLQHLARRVTEDPDAVPAVHRQMQALASGMGGHLRHAQTFAFLMTGWLMFAEFARATGAITQDQVTERLDAVEAALRQAARQQDDASHDVRPDIVFIDVLGDLFGAGNLHLAGIDGGRPDDPTIWGWRSDTDRGHDDGSQSGRGEKVGWVDNDGLYLIPAVARRQVERTLAAQGEHLALSDRAMREALRRGGFLRPGNKEHGRRHNRWLEGRSHNVLFLDRQAVLARWEGGRM